jgi:hypothetical protein
MYVLFNIDLITMYQNPKEGIAKWSLLSVSFDYDTSVWALIIILMFDF